ncbi:MAG: hypothetical protein ACREFL_03650 [Stellaceae bacterium]
MATLAGCGTNPANVRTLASTIQTVTSDTPNIVAADKASCRQNAALQDEYKNLENQTLAPLQCGQLAAVLDSLLELNKALQAYGAALNSMAQDQFVTADADSNAVTGSLQTLEVVPAPVVAAVGSLFSLVETAALQGYRQHELAKAMTGQPAAAFKTVMAAYVRLGDQYAGALERQQSNTTLISNAIVHDYSHTEPVAAAEMSIRLAALHDDVANRAAAIKDFAAAVAKVDPAFDAAAQDLTNPSPKEIYTAVKAFAAQVKDTHDKLKAAVGGP